MPPFLFVLARTESSDQEPKVILEVCEHFIVQSLFYRGHLSADYIDAPRRHIGRSFVL
jgi:hypothetical protein